MTAAPDGDQVPAGTWIELGVTVNGREITEVIPAHRRLADFLREDLGLTGTKIGCGVGVCGACTVLVDGRPTSACLLLAAQADGSAIRTVEGLSDSPRLRALQEAFVAEGGFQCGYCTSGQLMTAAALFLADQIPGLSDEAIVEHMTGTLCRCTGYYGIQRAIRKASS